MLTINQDGLPEGEPGRSRTDGLSTGALVTLTNTGAAPGALTAFALLWTPPGDVSASASLAPTGDPSVWTFTPTAGKIGSYLVELTENAGRATERRERRTLGVRTPNLGLLIPALLERGPANGGLVDNNATDYADPDLNALDQAGWWRAMHELIMHVDGGGGGGGTTLAPGSVYGQPLVWLDTEWGPLDPGAAIVVERIQAELALLLDPGGNLTINAPTIVLDVTPAFGTASLTLSGNTVAITGDEIGFYGTTPQARPAIFAGENTQAVLDSLIAALVQVGLITDER